MDETGTAAGAPPESEASAPYQDEHIEDTGSGVFRAGVFGANDGLVSNLGLVVGVAAATPQRSAVLLAGIAGLLAGAFSMAAGEYISMKTQRELFERELEVERQHIVAFPDQEKAHLTDLLAAAGLSPEVARRVAEQVHASVEPAVGFHARFELGINPDELGAPRGAAFSSFVAFCAGAIIPLSPWFLAEGTAGIVSSVVMAAVALTLLGALATRWTHQKPLFSAGRQLLIGAVTTAVTYGIGWTIGVSVS